MIDSNDAVATAEDAPAPEFTQGALELRMGIEIVEATPDRVVATMPVEGNTQPYGTLYGGASCVLAETVGSIGASLHFQRTGGIALGTEINATHHRMALSGLVTATATAVIERLIRTGLPPSPRSATAPEYAHAERPRASRYGPTTSGAGAGEVWRGGSTVGSTFLSAAGLVAISSSAWRTIRSSSRSDRPNWRK